MDSVFREIRAAGRGLRRQPGFTVLSVLTLALGVAAVTTVFALTEGVLLRPLPVRDAEEVVWVWQSEPAADVPMVEISYPMFRDLRQRTRAFEDLAALPSTLSSASLDLVGSLQDVPVASVSANYFSLLGTPLTLGRSFLVEEDQVAAAGVAIVGFGLWQGLLGGQEEVLGTSLILDGEDFRVVGVAPRGFDLPQGAQIWLPLAPTVAQFYEDRSIRFLHAVGRLAPGRSPAEGREELRRLIEDLATEHPEASVAPEVVVTSLPDLVFGPSRPVLWGFLAAVVLLLLLATSNVLHLFLARATSRRQELAMRRALGAEGWRLQRFLGLEALILGLLASAIALPLAAAGLRLLRRLPAVELPRLETVHIGPLTVALALGLSLVAALGGSFAAAPAGREDLLPSLRGQTPGSGRRWGLKNGLAISQIALALALLVGAGLTVKTLARLRAIDPGFEANQVLSARIFLPADAYPDPDQRRRFFLRLEESMAAITGVESSAAVLIRPLETTNGWDVPFAAEGQPEGEQKKNTPANLQVVGNDFFQTLRVPLVRGRTFSREDAATGPLVVVVGESLARRYWPQGDAVGRRLRLFGANSTDPWRTVVGVVADVRFREWRTPTADLYVPLAQNPLAQHMPYSDVVLRSRHDALALVAPLEKALHTLDPQVPLRRPALLDELVATRLAPSRLNAGLLGTFAALALLLAAVGIYGILNFTLSQRRREFGVRMAIGASRSQVLGQVLLETCRLALVGILIGSALSFLLSRSLRGLLYGVQPVEGLLLGMLALGVTIVVLAASLAPAWKTSRVDPMRVLRAE